MLLMKRGADTTPTNCYECHFLCGATAFAASLADLIVLDIDQRKKLVDGTYFDHIDPQGMRIGCALEWWEYKSGKDHLDELKEAILKLRGDSCNWFPRSPGMTFVAGKRLEERMTYLREARLDRKWVKWGVCVAAVALVLNLGWNVGWGIWEHFNPPKIAPQKAATSTTQPDPSSSPRSLVGAGNRFPTPRN